ncbi:MAG TPA: hypothetical protein VFZ83_15505 [Acidimicrobiia bacterium]|nr:hypothetical protein [Acidimicrobiia bacterium]
MDEPTRPLDGLERRALLPIAHEYMLAGMVVNRALLPQVVMRGAGLDGLNQVAIDLWMGASPVYTHRLRALMGIEGDTVEAIMKALQLDVGFVHQYMSVAYAITDDRHGEFWLEHCGALLDAEPHGEPHVVGMCHTIEDPTFDATALATNPRARIRPIHRPPRVPSDRHPHCHWTITIDPDNEPVGPAALTEQVAALPLSHVTNPPAPGGGGMSDYRDAFRPDFRLGDLATDTLAAVAREFLVQTHLLVAAGELASRVHFDEATSRAITRSAWIGTAWITSERLGALVEGSPRERVARVLALTPAIPPGFARTVATGDEADGDTVTLTLVPERADLLDAAHPGCPGLLASGEVAPFAAMVHAIERRAAVAVTVHPDRVEVVVGLDPSTATAPEPDEVALMRIGMVTGWRFHVEDRLAPSA